jgi:hypothetical protein
VKRHSHRRELLSSDAAGARALPPHYRRRVAISLLAGMLRSFATFSIASRSSFATTMPSHMALWAWRYTSHDEGADACGSGDCFAMPPGPCVVRGQPAAGRSALAPHEQSTNDTSCRPRITVAAGAVFRFARCMTYICDVEAICGVEAGFVPR